MALSAQTIADAFDDLNLQDQLWLMERLARHIRQQSAPSLFMTPQDLAAMAADSNIQSELQDINAEFAGTELDGLDEDA